MKRALYKIIYSRASVFSGLISLMLASGPACAQPEGPLFVQVHYSNPVSSLSTGQLRKLLSGNITSFKLLNGPRRQLEVYCDSRIAGLIKRKYPALVFKAALFDRTTALAKKKSFLGISDRRGIQPCFKTLYIDGKLPWGSIGNDYSLEPPSRYPFLIAGARPWDSKDHFSIVQTGVTAMSRAFIRAVDRSGDILTPVRFTQKITSRGDIAMTSNEVSFLDPCTYPLKNNLEFCSPVRFFSILSHSGFDVIELTGNHNNDFGREHNLRTMSMIEKAGMVYFGGGKNRSEALRVRYRTVKHRRIAFVGFNEQGPPGAWATEKGPGAARLDRSVFERAVGEARKNADIVFLTVQWGNETHPRPWTKQTKYFHRAVELGADIIVSSSAHMAMGIEFHRGRFISYGLGNFLFDQMQTISHRRGLIARHHFYKGRHIETELIPYLIHNYSQPRPVRGDEARGVFRHVFKYSLGPVFQ